MVKRGVIQSHDVPWTKMRHDDLLDEGIEDVPIDGSRDLQPAENPINRQGTHDTQACACCRQFRRNGSLTARRIAIVPAHARHDPHLVHRHHIFGSKLRLLCDKGLASRLHVWPILFRRAVRLFFRVSPARCSSRQIVGWLTSMPVWAFTS